jgi:hypothetical protein
MVKIRIKVEGYFILSKAQKDINKVIEESIEEAKLALLKGSERDPDNACYLNDWNVNENILNVNLTSGNLVRAHVGMLRLKKVFAKNL